ncbi:hypothetical protein VIGAN_03181900 [Vigna angularis var. angularis]|uniref:Uncharacterized protein n=2 Tax=Vigna TaxID=3913 RepID=A0A0S3RMV0_PHAAN|nr:hypothetical protein VIGAN_03181900 [Vigna angularis var. angularis]
MHHTLVFQFTPFSALSHQPCFHHIKWTSTDRTCCACKESRNHRLPWLEDFPIPFMLLPQKHIKSIFGSKHGRLVCPITHHSRSNTCPKTPKSFFSDNHSSTVNRTFVFQKLRA